MSKNGNDAELKPFPAKKFKDACAMDITSYIDEWADEVLKRRKAN